MRFGRARLHSMKSHLISLFKIKSEIRENKFRVYSTEVNVLHYYNNSVHRTPALTATLPQEAALWRVLVLLPHELYGVPSIPDSNILKDLP